MAAPSAGHPLLDLLCREFHVPPDGLAAAAEQLGTAGDDLAELKHVLIKAKIVGAEGLILASPNYINNVSAQMKGFMDRCCGVVHCLQFWGKYGVSVVTSGGDGDEQSTGQANQQDRRKWLTR